MATGPDDFVCRFCLPIFIYRLCLPARLSASFADSIGIAMMQPNPRAQKRTADVLRQDSLAMADILILIRHGETEWSRSGQHTSTTDITLTEAGREAASALEQMLTPWTFSHVISSPRQRARDTARLALPNFDGVEVTEEIAEWAYGELEGKKTAEIRASRPEWDMWTGGCPGGESPSHVTTRLDALLQRVETYEGTVGIVAHGHILRALAARYIGADVSLGRNLYLDTASISVLSTHRNDPVILRWNVTSPAS